MKIVCPVCGLEGVLQQRGNNRRVIHYSWQNGKRVFWQHKLVTEMVTMVTEDGNGYSSKTFLLENKECSGRDLNPGPRLERPLYLTGLYYRSNAPYPSIQSGFY